LPAEIFRGTTSSSPAILETKPAASATKVSGPADPASLARALFQWARQDDKLKVIPAVERELIIQALAETKGNQVRAAKLLGITRATLRKRVEKFNIKKELSIG
jgi:DNA-binding NtrC family response regulator